jgi:predicted nucleotidyltransferase
MVSMSSTARIEIRVHPATKAEFERLCAQYQVNVSGILNAFIEDCCDKGKLPERYVKVGLKRRKRRAHLISFNRIRLLTQKIAATFTPEEIQEVYLFGSYARGEATEKSDVDLWIVPGAELSLPREGEFNETMAEAFDRPVDTVVSDSALDPRFVQSVDHDKILLYSRAKETVKKNG